MFIDPNPFKDKLSVSESLPTTSKMDVFVNDNYMAELKKESTHDQNMAKRKKNKKDRNLSIH